MTEISSNKRRDVDGGWAWVVLGGCLYVAITVPVTTIIFGIQMGPLTKQLNLSDMEISMVANIFNVFFNLMLFTTGPLTQEFGFRKVAIVSAAIASAGYCLIIMADSALYLICAFSVLVGSMGGITNALTYTILPYYFEKKRGFAIALFFTAVGAGCIFMPQLVRYLNDEYGSIGSILIYAGLLLNCCVVGALFRPVPESVPLVTARTHPSSHDLILSASAISLPVSHVAEADSPEGVFSSIAKRFKECLRMYSSCRVLINGISISSFLAGYINFQMLIPYLMIDKGFSYQSAAWVMSVSAIFNTISRASMAVLSDKKWFNVKIAYMASTAVAGTFTVAFPLYSNFTWYCITGACYGLGLGVTVSLWVTLLIQTVGMDIYIPSLGACGSLTALCFLISGPIFGYIKLYVGSYSATVIACGVMQLVPPFLWSLMPIAIKVDLKRNNAKGRKNNIAVQQPLHNVK